MKKILFGVLGLCISVNAFAACGPHQDCPNENDRLSVDGVGCYTCHTTKNGGCGDSYMLAVLGGARVKGSGGNTKGQVIQDALWSCKAGGAVYDDHWTYRSQIPVCKNGGALKNDKNAHKVLYNGTYGNNRVTSGNGVYVGGTSANTACIRYECDNGFFPSADGTKCEKGCQSGNSYYKRGWVQTGKARTDCHTATLAQLKDKSNVKNGQLCLLKCNNNAVWELLVTEEACTNGYVPSADSTKCVKGAALIASEKQAAANKKQAEANKQKCEQSWGTWSGGKCVCDASKNLINDTNVSCACKSASYERNESSKSCEMTSVAVREQKCKDAAASGAMWTGDKCVCELPHREWNGAACIDPAGYAQCKAVQGAMWNTTMKTCVCTDSTKVFDGTKCVESEETKQKREASEAQLAVSDAVARLDSIVSTLEVSKWKDAEGKFNTARLASDSIAGVVLGTAGGLITSSVVKKHQVEEGFEDLQCVIGGQTVAGWGDEFTVGVQ